MPGWEYSIGCAIELAHASIHDIRAETLSGAPVSIDDGIALLRTAHDDLRADDANGALTNLAAQLSDAIGRLQKLLRPATTISQGMGKAASLDLLAERGMNVAQFVSFSPEQGKPRQEYSRIAGRAANKRFSSLRSAFETLLQASVDRCVNVRSYAPNNRQSREFIRGLASIDEITAAVERLSAEGLHTIVNESIDVADGGVSGVLMGNVLKFAPDDTPRCVEKPGTASLPRGWARTSLLSLWISGRVTGPFREQAGIQHPSTTARIERDQRHHMGIL